MAAEINEKLGMGVELIKGQKGIFDVKYGDKLIFSKHQSERFPEHHEVIEPLQEMTAQ